MVTTPGGHRRFRLSDLRRLAHSQASPPALASTPPPDLATRTLRSTRDAVADHDASWLEVSEKEREESRALGRRMVGLMLQYVAAEDGEGDSLLTEARAIGRLQAKGALRKGQELSDAIRATHFFRDRIIESAVLQPSAEVHGEEGIRTRQRLYRRLNAFLNEVQVAIADVFGAE